MENKEYREQPESILAKSSADYADVKEEGKEQEGSLYGKFKTAEDLLKAYENLEAEFTRKSQKLSMLEKSQLNEAENTNILSSNAQQVITGEYAVPAFEKESWLSDVKAFYENNPRAKGFEEQIATLILSDKELMKSSTPLEQAWQKVAIMNAKSPSELLTDEKMLEKIYSSREIRENILKQYLSELKTAPIVISSKMGKEINIAKKAMPKTLEDARSVAEKLFN